jgi:hypothetical protein
VSEEKITLDSPIGAQIRNMARSPSAGREYLRQLAGKADGLEARAAVAEAEAERRSRLTVSEPTTYQRGGPHSFFADLARLATGLGDKTAAKKRLGRHEDELAAFYPRWREARAAQAQAAYENAFAASRRGEQLLEQMEKYGLRRFRGDDAFKRQMEKRAISTSTGSAGYFTPPLWALEDWASAARAGRPFADLCWTSLPLPPGIHSVNVPHWTVGLATGPQTDGGSVDSSSAADLFATSTVTTIAGTQDVAMQYMEQTQPPGYDQFLGQDLIEDAGGNLSAQLLIGSGSNQLNGIVIGGAASASNLVVMASTQNVSASTLIAASGATPVWTTVGDMLYVMQKARGLRPTHIVVNPAVWWKLTGTLDGNGRPVVLPSSDAPQPRPDGVLGEAWSLPVVGDANMPTTFGGGTAPTVAASGAVSASTAGNGTGTVIAAVRRPDLFLFEGDIRIRVMQEVVAGSGQWRYQIMQYVAALRDRYTWAGSNISYTNGSGSGGVNAGGSVSAGATTNYETNSPLAGL